jgi:pimeloyl-ACP methyl ester carboxylesterase
MQTADIVLIHGFTATRRVWEPVVEHLPDGLRTHLIALPGHRHGPPLDGEGTIAAMLDGVARDLDRLGLARPHLVGNSLGGWLALELGAMGRAASVLAFAPAGFWDAGGVEQRRRAFTRARAAARRSRPLLPLLFRSGVVRRLGMRTFAEHGERLTPAQALEATDGLLGCTAYPGLIDTTVGGARRFDRLPCPVRIRLSEHDRVLHGRDYAERVRARVAGADLTTLAGVGHVPMIDDPALVAREIVSAVRAAG